MVALAKELYISREDLLIAYEREILMSLNFNVTFADPFSLYNHHLISNRHCSGVSEETVLFIYHCGGYLVGTRFPRVSPSVRSDGSVERFLFADRRNVAGRTVL